jgi:hypothetical protein
VTLQDVELSIAKYGTTISYRNKKPLSNTSEKRCMDYMLSGNKNIEKLFPKVVFT